MGETLVVDRVDPAGAARVHLDEAVVEERLEMLRYGRPRNRQPFGEFVDGARPPGQFLQELASVRISNSRKRI